MPEFMSPPEMENPRTKLSELLKKYIAGDSHEHTVFSNPTTRHEADYTFEQVFDYIKKEMNEGENQMQFVILAEHPSDAGDPRLVDGSDLLEHQNKIHQFIEQQKMQDIELPEMISGVEASIISADGQLDVPQEILSQMDFVIASKHDLRKVFPESNGNPNAEQLTQMYLGLMNNPHVDVIGHPNRYVSYEVLDQVDWDQLLNTAKETNTALEINVNAPMPPVLIKKLVSANVPIFIGTDAHTLKQYQNLPNEVNGQIEDVDRLNYPLSVKYSFWKQIAKVLRTLEEAECPPEQIITSSKERLNNWLSKEKSEREIEFGND